MQKNILWTTWIIGEFCFRFADDDANFSINSDDPMVTGTWTQQVVFNWGIICQGKKFHKIRKANIILIIPCKQYEYGWNIFEECQSITFQEYQPIIFQEYKACITSQLHFRNISWWAPGDWRRPNWQNAMPMQSRWRQITQCVTWKSHQNFFRLLSCLRGRRSWWWRGSLLHMALTPLSLDST